MLGVAHAVTMLGAFLFQETLGGIPAAFLMLSAIILAVTAARLVTGRPRALLLSLLFGLATMPFWLVTHLFIWAITGPGFIPLLLHFCLYPAAFVWLLARLNLRRARWPAALTVPVLWVGLEILRGEYVWSGYPWYLAGHSVTAFLRYQPGSVLGAYGVSFALAAFAGWLGRPLPRGETPNSLRRLGATFGIVVAGCISLNFIGWLGAPAAPVQPRTFRLAVLQTNLPQDNKLAWKIEDRVADANRWYALTAQAAAATPTPDLIVWPETMFPGNAFNPQALRSEAAAGMIYRVPDPSAGGGGGQRTIPATWFADELLRIQKQTNVPILIGALAADGQRFDFTTDGKLARIHADARYNSAHLIRHGIIEETRYDKIDLMPFGEYIPVLWRWPDLQNQAVSLGAAGMAFDLQFGQYRTVFTLEPSRSQREGRTSAAPSGEGPSPFPVRIVTPICFEGSYARSCRRLVAESGGDRRADLMVNLTNDGWFGSLGALSDFSRRMHLLNCRWRCIELGTPMVRAANTGISAVIDHRGRVLRDSLDPQTPGGLREPSARHEGLMTADVPLLPANAPVTLYARFGHWLEPLIGLAALAFAAVALFTRPRS